MEANLKVEGRFSSGRLMGRKGVSRWDGLGGD